MIDLHRVFREAASSGRRFVAPEADGDAIRAEYVGTYYDNVFRLLHAHHEGEDLLMTPRLMSRGTPDEAAEVSRIADQHHAVLGQLRTASERVATWRAEPTAANRDAVVAALAGLQGSLIAHLDEEERVVLPIASRLMTPAEWGEMPEHGMKSFDGDKLWLALGLVLEQMTPQQVAGVEAHMPPPVADFWTSTG